jgi:uncharacterized protein
VGTPLPLLYDCLDCPSYCCTYPRIEVTPEDIRRLARHFGIDEATARKRFTKKGWEPDERVLRHHADETFGTACRFLDLDSRLCTVHEARPEICRDHPGRRSCGYYTFLMAEREDQEDPDLVARAYNVPGEWPELAED